MNERKVMRGFIANVEVVPPLIVTFQFNPEKIDDNKGVRFANLDARASGSPSDRHYQGGGFREISLTIDLHGLEQGTNALNPTAVDNGISTELAKLRSFLYPKVDAWALARTAGLADSAGDSLDAPPTCLFGFGAKILECRVTDMKVSETQFNSALAPVRAEVTLTLTVIEKPGGGLYELDTLHRNSLAALGLQNIEIY